MEKWSARRHRRCCCRSARRACATTRRRIPAATRAATRWRTRATTLLNEPANVWVDPGPDPETGQARQRLHRRRLRQPPRRGVQRDGTARTCGSGAASPERSTTRRPTRAAAFAAGDGGHPHCVVGGNDGMIYVCDRADDRIQVFTKIGAICMRIIAVVPGTGVDAGNRRRGRARHCRLGVGSRASPTTRCRRTCSRSTAETRSCTPWTACAGTIVADLGQPGHEPGQFTLPAQQHGRLEGQRLHRRDDQRTPHPEVRARRVQQRQRQGRRQRQLRRLKRMRGRQLWADRSRAGTSRTG